MPTTASWKGYTPPDLQTTPTASADAAKTAPTGSYDKIIRLPLVKDKKYRFWFTYLYEDAETKELTEGQRSPIVELGFDIPNLTKPVINLSVTQGYRAYSVKFDMDPLSVQEDIVIYESLSADFSNPYIVYVGTSTNITIQTGSTAQRWVKVVVRDKWLDTNRSESPILTVTPLNPDPDTTYTVANPTTTSASASIDPKDLSGFSVASNITWAVATDTKTAGYALRWSTTNPNGGTPLWEYASVSGRTTNTYTATGLIPNTTYYYQVAAKTPYDTTNWTGAATSTFIASDADGTAAGALARLKSFIAIGGATQDLFKIGTGIAQSINLNTEPLASPTLTAGTYHGILLNKSTTNVGNNFWLTTGQFRVGNSSEFLYWNGTDLYLTGSIEATGGKFTGNVQLAIPTGGTTSGSLYAGASATSGARLRLNSDGLFAYNGLVTDATVSITKDGTIDARKGYIGGWTIDGSAQTTGTISKNNTILDSNGNISVGDKTGTLGSAVRLSATDPTYRIWVGSTSSSNAPFRVSTTGVLTAAGAIFTGSPQIEGYAKTADLTTLSTSLSTSVGAKNATFAQSTTPTATKVGDIWIDTGQGNIIKTWTGSVWTQRTDTSYATKTALDAKLTAGGYLVANAQNQVTSITSNGITITSTGFKINTDTTATAGANMVILNSQGIASYNSAGAVMFSINSNGNAEFKGNISGASGTFSGRVAINTSSDTAAYFDSAGSLGGVTAGLVVGSIGFKNTSIGGWTSHCYPYMPGAPNIDLGTRTYRWNDVRISGNVMVGHSGADNDDNGTTVKTKLLSGGNIYANALGTATTANFITQSSGFLRVNTSSSRRYKTDIVDIDTIDALNPENLLNIPVRAFRYNAEHLSESDQRSGVLMPGFIAEEVESVYPSAVDYNDDGLPERWNTNIIIPGMLSLIQKQSLEISNLKQRLDAIGA
jgi:hypothetical protein